MPDKYALEQNYPNPFNPATVIRYQLPVKGLVMLKVYDVLGREVKTVLDKLEDAGFKSISWNASGFTSGVYFYRLEAVSISDPYKSFTQVKKMLLLK